MCQVIVIQEICSNCSSCVATEGQKLLPVTRPLERVDVVSVRKAEIRRPNRHNTFRASTRDLSSLRSGLCRPYSSKFAMVAKRPQNILPFDFGAKVFTDDRELVQIRVADRYQRLN